MIRTFIGNIGYYDTILFLKIFSITGKRPLDRLMLLVTRSGNGLPYAAIGLAVLMNDFAYGLRFISAGLTAFGMELTLYFITKKSIKRKRPFETIPKIRNLIEPPDTFSFPSGHAAGAFLMAALVSCFFPGTAVPAYVFAGLIAISRVYLGVHYPLDIIAGAVIGTACAKTGVFLSFSFVF